MDRPMPLSTLGSLSEVRRYGFVISLEAPLHGLQGAVPHSLRATARRFVSLEKTLVIELRR